MSVKFNVRDNIESCKTDVATAVNALKELKSRNLPATARDLTDLGKMQPVNPRDPLRRANVIADPQREAADIRDDLRMILKKLEDAKVLISQNVELVTEMLG